MDSDSGIQVRISRRHDGGHGAARRHAGNIDAPRIDVMRPDHFARHSSDDRRLALIPALIGCVEPIPASSTVRRFGLLRIQDEDALLLADGIHARTEREIIGILQAAVQHHQQAAAACPHSGTERKACSAAIRSCSSRAPATKGAGWRRCDSQARWICLSRSARSDRRPRATRRP